MPDELPLHVVDTGSTGESTPPLVLLHGYTGSSDDWAGVIGALAVDRRVIAPEHRGHGRSHHYGVAGAYTFDLLLADLEATLDDLGLDRFDLLGHSMGGVIAMRYVLAHPERVRSLVLMDTFAEPLDMPVDVVAQALEYARTNGMDALYELVAGLNGEAPTDEARTKFTRVDLEAFGALGAELGSYPSMLDRLATIACPTTVLVGENDGALVGGAERMAALIPGAELVVVADAGHSPQVDQPDLWLAAVRRHLERRGSTGAEIRRW